MVLKYSGFFIPEDDGWQPDDLIDFGFEMDFYVGGDNGSDAFTALVCSPSWFARERGAEVRSGRNVIFMPRFDRNELDSFLNGLCAEENGKSTEATMLKIDGIGEWEYRYRS
ncbi:Imm8 family immunity protein [Rhizobium etli]|uniref:Immunity protein 8 of polymorphic toxin system n=1 Tax=Rhizobium etli TaxID=29449 RepID=A0A7W6V6Z5_RHIET|nr:Imm8 family immunity protein [Rhizobium etli]MBB4478814.1 hypothetical protein [Rhizobium etli]MBB4534992.1 hypothetical protein [Rhizobium etli]